MFNTLMMEKISNMNTHSRDEGNMQTQILGMLLFSERFEIGHPASNN